MIREVHLKTWLQTNFPNIIVARAMLQVVMLIANGTLNEEVNNLCAASCVTNIRSNLKNLLLILNAGIT